MKISRIAATATPYLAAVATGFMIALMIATMSLTASARNWIVFLSGVLAAAVLSWVSYRAGARSKAIATVAPGLSHDVAAPQIMQVPPAPPAKPAPFVPAERSVSDPASNATAARLIDALRHDEFSLYSQAIVPLEAAGGGATFCEVLLRMKEEEEKLLPPGSFLPVAEEHGLLPDVDRWVIRNVLDTDAALGAGSDAVYFVNLSPQTAASAGFAAFVHAQLDMRNVDGKLLCFEFPESDVLAQPEVYRDLITALEGSGCRFAVSGFGHGSASVQFLTKLRVSYVKLDGEVALSLARGPEELARAQALIVAAHAAGMEVVAQCVENELARASLRLLKADFVQGFGIAMPRPMGPPSALRAAA